MNKNAIISFLIVILTGVTVYYVVNLPDTKKLAEEKLWSEFSDAQMYVGLSGQNISDEKIILNGAKPSIMNIGYPQSIEYKDGKYFLTIDLALWFSEADNGEITNNATKAMKEDGDLYEEGATNGYYIRNNNHALKTFEVSHGAPIYTIDAGSGVVKPLTHIAEFKTLLDNDPVNNLVPFVFDLENNVITKAYQHYVP